MRIACGGPRQSVGSGTVVAVDGEWSLVLTCRHLGSKDTGLIKVRFPFTGREVEGIHYDLAANGADLAAIVIKTGSQLPPLARLADRGVDRPGLAVTQSGWPGGRELVRRQGHITGSRGYYGNGIPCTHLDFPVIGGDSGSGVFTGDGQLVAVVWGADHNSTTATGLDEIWKFLDQKCVRFFPNLRRPFQRPPSQPGPSAPVQPGPSAPAAPAGPPPPMPPACPCDNAALSAKLDLLAKQLAELQALGRVPGPVGPAGPQGPAGPGASALETELAAQRKEIEALRQQLANISGTIRIRVEAVPKPK